MRSHRRVSCRDLGAGECDGWLWKKKTNATSPLTSKWSKRWVVLKENALYCYHTEEDEKAESYIYLPGYKITPAEESKKRFAFRVAHPLRKTFFFASDRQLDMSRWMNKLGLAAIEYSFTETDNHTTKDGGYVSESDSEEISNASESESTTKTPDTSPEKPLKHPLAHTTSAMSTPPRNRAGRHMSTQPDLNRSARYPRNKAEQLKTSATTQTTDSLQRQGRNRSKSETAKPASATNGDQKNAIVNPQSNGNHSHATSPKKTAIVSPENKKHKVDDTRRKQYRHSSHQSSNVDTDGVTTSHSEEEVKHVKLVASKKAEELAKRESQVSASSLMSAQAGDSQNSGEVTGMFGKGKKQKKKPPAVSLGNDESGANEIGMANDNQSSPRARDIVGRPKLRSESNPETTTSSKVTDGSMDDLCKALQNADVDIRGVSRKATLKRRLTILSRDPRKNDLLLRKRALQRQIKAREGELEYIKLLDDKVITSELIHDWINQHQSFFSELGTIRRLSKRKRNPMRTEEIMEKQTDDASGVKSSTATAASKSTPPIPAKRTSLLLSDSPHEQTTQDTFTRNDHPKLSDSEVPPAYSPLKSLPSPISVRPRSWAISVSESEKIKARSSRSISPNFEAPTQTAEEGKPYLETDL